MKSTRKKVSMITRLRETREESRDSLKDEGERLGDTWAREEATYSQLIHVASGSLSDLTWAAFSAIVHHEPVYLDDRLELDGELSNTLVRGFIAGATGVWDEVEARLCPKFCVCEDDEPT